ncbi:hypothetical protein [Shewanella sp. GXUN23E]|uniref:hypothetical protein n=1 Tax=Shewanella sp. GXUN23E TaxID=3422498 RepID=UPI003D7D5B31
MDFSQINKLSAKSFNDQKNLIKRIGKGQTVHCADCGQVLQLRVPGKNPRQQEQEALYGIHCPRGCTDIELEFEA